MTDYELGYTPENLRKVLKDNGLSQKEIYDYIGKSRGVFSRYLLSSDEKYHVSMNHSDWLKIINYIAEVKSDE
ncbi:helix-turn-helix domain-containing protein [Pantoea agglomerans]|uniref:helix-turn-helix domain-containing protein n=1 Tax=Enterobacter agglomerans TaxID=549 RepID=UPI0039094AD7